MTRLLIGLAAFAFLTATPALAASSLDGTWKGDLKTAQLPKKPDVFLVEKGTYTCKTCVPELSVPADGAWHKVTGHPYYDEAMYKVVDAHKTMEAYRKDGKPTSSGTTMVSADGKTLTFDFTDVSGTKPINQTGTAKLTAKGPAGSHAVSGSWQTTSVDSVSDAGLTFAYKTAGDMLTMTTPAGYGYTAKFGGPAVAITGDKGGTMASIKKTPAGFVETDMRGGKVVSVYTTTVAADGKSQTVVVDDKEHGTTTTYKAMKQ